MRKSRSIRLVLLGSAGFALSACNNGPPDDAVFFEDVPACSARFGEEKCTKAYEKAKMEHLNHAPVSLPKEECETDFGEGNCEARYMPSNRPYYVPAMKGFMTAGGSYGAPVYADRDNSAIVADGDNVFRVGAFTQGAVTGVLVRSAIDAAAGKAANAGPRPSTMFRREVTERVSANGFAARATRGGLGSTASRHHATGG